MAGIGPAKARSLVDSGISTIEQLRDPSNEVRIFHAPFNSYLVCLHIFRPISFKCKIFL